MNANQKAALALATSNGKLTERGHSIINANIKFLLDAGLLTYGSGKKAYVLTAAGKEALK